MPEVSTKGVARGKSAKGAPEVSAEGAARGKSAKGAARGIPTTTSSESLASPAAAAHHAASSPAASPLACYSGDANQIQTLEAWCQALSDQRLSVGLHLSI